MFQHGHLGKSYCGDKCCGSCLGDEMSADLYNNKDWKAMGIMACQAVHGERVC